MPAALKSGGCASHVILDRDQCDGMTWVEPCRKHLEDTAEQALAFPPAEQSGGNS